MPEPLVCLRDFFLFHTPSLDKHQARGGRKVSQASVVSVNIQSHDSTSSGGSSASDKISTETTLWNFIQRLATVYLTAEGENSYLYTIYSDTFSAIYLSGRDWLIWSHTKTEAHPCSPWAQGGVILAPE
jgi:hypothetical protein